MLEVCVLMNCAEIEQSTNGNETNIAIASMPKSRQKRVIVFRPLFVYRQEQVKKMRLQEAKKRVDTTTKATTTTTAAPIRVPSSNDRLTALVPYPLPNVPYDPYFYYHASYNPYPEHYPYRYPYVHSPIRRN